MIMVLRINLLILRNFIIRDSENKIINKTANDVGIYVESSCKFSLANKHMRLSIFASTCLK